MNDELPPLASRRNTRDKSFLGPALGALMAGLIGMVAWNVSRLIEHGELLARIQSIEADQVKYLDQLRLQNDEWRRAEKEYNDRQRAILDQWRQDFDHVQANQQINTQRLDRIEHDLFGMQQRHGP